MTQDGLVDPGVGGEMFEAEADRRVGLSGNQAEGSEYIIGTSVSQNRCELLC